MTNVLVCQAVPWFLMLNLIGKYGFCIKCCKYVRAVIQNEHVESTNKKLDTEVLHRFLMVVCLRSTVETSLAA